MNVKVDEITRSHVEKIGKMLEESGYFSRAVGNGKCGRKPIKANILPTIEKVVFNDPVTVVLWDDGTKTVVKCGKKDKYSKDHGLAMCIAKKYFGSRSKMLKTIESGYSKEPEKTRKKPTGKKTKKVSK